MRIAARTVAVSLALVSLLSMTACRRGDSAPPAGVSGSSTHTLDFGGERREYRLFVPANRTDPAPVVFMLHGGFGSAEHAERHYGWDEAAERHGFVVAYPDGLGRAWNVGGGCCGASGKSGVDDVGFIDAVLADVGRQLTIDPARVYATGMSNGAMLSHRLACDTDTFAAIAPVAGTLMGDCPDPEPISVLHIHGLADANVRYDGAVGDGFAKVDGPPVPEVMELWRTASGCAAPSTTTGENGVTTVEAECPQGRDVMLVTIAGAGHQWPRSTTNVIQDLTGADPPSTAIDATETIAQFFAAHPKP